MKIDITNVPLSVLHRLVSAALDLPPEDDDGCWDCIYCDGRFFDIDGNPALGYWFKDEAFYEHADDCPYARALQAASDALRFDPNWPGEWPEPESEYAKALESFSEEGLALAKERRAGLKIDREEELSLVRMLEQMIEERVLDAKEAGAKIRALRVSAKGPLGNYRHFRTQHAGSLPLWPSAHLNPNEFEVAYTNGVSMRYACDQAGTSDEFYVAMHVKVEARGPLDAESKAKAMVEAKGVRATAEARQPPREVWQALRSEDERLPSRLGGVRRRRG